MGKSWLFRLFGIGSVPQRVRAGLEAERILVLDEGIRGSVTYRDYRAPGKRFGLRRVWFTGSLVVTGMRIAGFAYGRNILNVTFDHPRIGGVAVRVEPEQVLCVALDAQAFHADRSGRLEFRFRTERAGEVPGLFDRAVGGRT